jgi:hypothetical protein
MKTALIPLLLIAGLNLAHAEDAASTTALTAEQARVTWQAMTPEQQAAAKAMAKSQATEKKAAWGALSDEDKSAKQATAKEKWQPTREAMQTKMQARMVNRPFGRR